MPAQTLDFKAEVKELLDLMIHSLYSHKEVFLRELISNASDAIDKARYESLTNPDLYEQGVEWKIRITTDKDLSTLTISDNGIGMTRDEIVAVLGTIAHSGTREFLKALKSQQAKDNPELIGQFGVGFYSSFMVADRVTVVSKRAGRKDAPAVQWSSAADGTFTIEDSVRDHPGTDVILHMKKDEESFLDEWRIRETIRKYSDFIEYPIVMDVEREEESSLEKGARIRVTREEKLNTGRAIWLKDKSEITAEEYNEFYRHVSHDFGDPAKVIHYRAEGTSEFVCLLYIPSRAPLDLFYKDFKMGPSLYVKKVQIMDHCEALLPPYLRFVRGVVDSSDLPLNVSREMLQANRQAEVIKNSITKKVLDTLAEMKKSEAEAFASIYREFGKVLKEGLHYDFTRREAITDLLLIPSTKNDGAARSVSDYVADMVQDQEAIYYLPAASIAEGLKSPHIEIFRKKGMEVLLMLDEIDDIVFSNLEYKGKKFKSVLKGDVKLDKEQDRGKEQKEFRSLIDLIKSQLSDDVKDVRISGRLTDSPCCLVGDEGDLDPRMERILAAMGQDVPQRKRILEINPGHPVFQRLRLLHEASSGDPLVTEYIALLFDQALLLEGAKPKDPARFAQTVSKLMLSALPSADEGKNA
ncbi:MAG: molecular chaperone HtpG [Thermodesulfovibrionales bacterium]